jgi:hypothetical protein
MRSVQSPDSWGRRDLSEMGNRVAQKLIALVFMMTTAANATRAADQVMFTSGENAASVIELFTSEGCSSCPPADAWMSQLKNNGELWKGIVPAVFHVDYWDGLGWRDRFAKAEFTQRQRKYVASWPTGAVYTPAFVVNGKEWPGFFNREATPKARSEKAGILSVALKGENEAVATFSPANSQRAPLKLEVAFLGMNLQSDVKRGENNGRKLHHDFVVLNFSKIDMTNQGDHWTGTVSFSIKPETDKPTALAAWIKSDETASPIQATGGWLSPGPY